MLILSNLNGASHQLALSPPVTDLSLVSAYNFTGLSHLTQLDLSAAPRLATMGELDHQRWQPANSTHQVNLNVRGPHDLQRIHDPTSNYVDLLFLTRIVSSLEVLLVLIKKRTDDDGSLLAQIVLAGFVSTARIGYLKLAAAPSSELLHCS